MDFYDPVVDEAPEKNEATTESNETNVKTEEAVHQIENEIEKVYTLLESRFQGLIHDEALQSKELIAQLNKLKENVNVAGNLEYLETQLANLRSNISKDYSVDKLTAQLSKINTTSFESVKGLSEKLPSAIDSQLDSLDEKLEIVERKGGEYLQQVGSFFSSFITVSEPAEEVKDELVFPSLSASKVYSTSRYDNDLYKLHTSENLYEESEADFDVDSKTDQITRLLTKYPETLDKLMNHLVPVKISYKSFWYSYFNQLGVIDKAELKRKELLANVNEEDFSWDDAADEESEKVKAKSVTSDKPEKVKSEKEKEEKEKKEKEEEESDDDWE